MCGTDSEPQSPESTQLESLEHTFKVDGRRRVSQVRVCIDRHVEITRLEMYYEATGDEESPVMAFGHVFEDRGRAYTCTIPDEQSIIGVYGRYECRDITSLGFIVCPSTPSCYLE